MFRLLISLQDCEFTDVAWRFRHDDPKFNEYLKLPDGRLMFTEKKTVGMHTGGPEGYCAGTNWLASLYPGYSGYFTGEDDYECLDPEWDRVYLAALPRDGVGLVWDNHRDSTPKLSTPHTVMAGWGWVERLGHVCQPTLRHAKVGNVWADLAAATKKGAALPQTFWYHNHQPAEPDYPTLEADKVAYREWRENEMAAQVNLLGGVR